MKGVLKALLSTLLLISLLSMVYAAPTGPDTSTVRDQGRHVNSTVASSGLTVIAQAGNVSEVILTQVRTTQAWQGYTGNVTGTITLDDGSNNTLYDWKLTTPSGEVYASNGTPVSWNDVECINFTSNLTDGNNYNLTRLNQGFGINESDLDSFNNTFNASFAGNFKVGNVTIDSNDKCVQSTLFVDEAHQSTDFVEVLLTDNTSVIFAALLENSQNGYKTGSDLWDFQMIVAQNGHPGFETTTTNYYFFLELS